MFLEQNESMWKPSNIVKGIRLNQLYSEFQFTAQLFWTQQADISLGSQQRAETELTESENLTHRVATNTRLTKLLHAAGCENKQLLANKFNVL